MIKAKFVQEIVQPDTKANPKEAFDDKILKAELMEIARHHKKAHERYVVDEMAAERAGSHHFATTSLPLRVKPNEGKGV